MMVAGGSRSDISVDLENTLLPRLDLRETTNVDTVFSATTVDIGRLSVHPANIVTTHLPHT
jgi:hypothetical protein